MGKGEFLMETGGHCFLCLERETTKVEPDIDAQPKDGQTTGKVFSLHSICKYLKLNMKEELAAEMISLVPSTDKALELSELKGTLCMKCARHYENFSSHLLELEVLQMKLQYDLKSIYDRMVEIKRNGAGKLKFQQEMLSRPETMAQYGIVTQLRKKTVELCYRKISMAEPRVAVQKASGPTVSSISGGIKMECCPDMNLILGPDGGHEIDDIIHYHNFPLSSSESYLPPIDVEVEAKPNPCWVECDICHQQVTDLFGHIAMAHGEAHGDANLVTGWGGTALPLFGMSSPAPLKFPKNIAKGRSFERRGVGMARTHNCDLCGKTFSQSGTLNRHRQKVHFAKMLKASKPIMLDFQPNLSSQESTGMDDPWAPEPAIPLTQLAKRTVNPKHKIKQHKKKNVSQKLSKLQQPSRTIDPVTGMHKCNLCAMEFKNYYYFNLHHRDAHLSIKSALPSRKNQTIIKAISTSADSPDDDKQPSSIVDPETGRHKCKICFKEFKTDDCFKIHYQSVHLNIKYECPVCGKEFNQRSSYARHHEMFHARAHKCQKCGMAFNEKGSLKRHQRRKICGKEERKQRLTEASGSEGKKKGRAVCRCHQCGKEFTGLSVLKMHFKTVHLKLKEHVCNRCGKSFSQKGYLGLHRCVGKPESQANLAEDNSNGPGDQGSTSISTTGE